METTKQEYSEGIAIFVDVLGTKGKENNFEELLKINKIFREKTSLLNNKNMFDSESHFERSVFTFSDCAFFLYKKNKSSTITIEKIVHLALNDISEISLKLLNKGIVFRGGAASGELYFENDGIFFGPAINEAYQIESKISKFPRICVEDNTAKKVIKYIDNLNPGARILNGSILNKDLNDHKFFINIFNSTEQGMRISSESKFGNILKKTKIQCSKNLKTYTHTEGIKEKYEWFSDYLTNVQIGQELKNTIISNGQLISPIVSKEEVELYLKKVNSKMNSTDLITRYNESSKLIEDTMGYYFPNLYYSRGLINFQLENYKHAIDDFKKELIGAPKDEEVYIRIAQSYELLSTDEIDIITRLNNAANFYEHAIKINPTSEAVEALNFLKMNALGMGLEIY